MRYTTLTSRTLRKTRGYKRSLDDDSDRSEHSSDSGLELDHQVEVQLATRGLNKKSTQPFEEDSNTEYCFPSMPGRGRSVTSLTTASLTAQLPSSTRDGRISLTIVSQPEQQHRARYQTEGSRGAVKDRTGNGFPVVKLTGYNKHCTLQIFVGTDVGRVAPHMFYQACRVSGKNSTPCVERKEEGTVLIEVDLEPSKDMLVTCDCVGILKERNVDVEHRFPEQSAARNKKKSTRCRMVFRTSVQNADGVTEILQVCSQPIACTQPPGIPEICKKSINCCPATGGLELFILGKNFLKDTRVVFQSTESRLQWEETVIPDKEFLQQNHLVCVVPPYRSPDISEPVTVRVVVSSSGKSSDPHSLVYLPVGANQLVPTPMDTQTSPTPSTSFFGQTTSDFVNGSRMLGKVCNVECDRVNGLNRWPSTKPDACVDEDTMMPPPLNHLPLRRPSLLPDRDEFKTEVMDDLSQHSMSVDGDSSHSPPALQCVDLSKKPPIMPHLSFSTSSPYLKTEPGQQFAVLYENEPQPFIDDTVMRPPPSKILVRDFAAGFMANEPPKEAAYNFDSRTRSGSFSHSSMADNSMSGFETLARVRSASMSHTFNSKTSPFPWVKETGRVLSSVLKQQETNHCDDQQPPFSCLSSPMPAVPLEAAMASSTMSDAAAVPLAPSLCDQASNVNRALDAIVNSAADTHISATEMGIPPQTSPFNTNDNLSVSEERTSPAAFGSSRSPSFLSPLDAETTRFGQPGQPSFSSPLSSSPQSTFSQAGSPQFMDGDMNRTSFLGATIPFQSTQFASSQGTPVPLTVAEISAREPTMGEMVLPPGPAPPITGMVPPEMVKMTDIDLISYINPSCFDQV